jgi:hypothetical protein
MQKTHGRKMFLPKSNLLLYNTPTNLWRREGGYVHNPG